MNETGPPSHLPPFHPDRAERPDEIPDIFMVDGYLRLTSEGRWLFRETPVTHPKFVRWMHKQLMRNTEGEYWVVNGPQRVPVDLDATPFFVVGVDVADDRAARLVLADGELEPLTPDVLWLDEAGVPHAAVKEGTAGLDGKARHPARFTRQAVVDLMPLIEEANVPGEVGLRFGEDIHVLANTPPAEVRFPGE